MSEYPKIENLYFRDPVTHKLDLQHLKVPAMGAIMDWVAYEKCDGMNIRITITRTEEAGVEIRGRTDTAQFRQPWVQYLSSIFTAERAAAIPDHLMSEHEITIYGELMGPKINGNPHGLEELEFRMFDVRGKRWYEQPDVDRFIHHFCTRGAPLVLNRASIGLITDVVRRPGLAQSQIGKGSYFEGVVARPRHELFDRFGNRMIFKLKTKDFQR